MTPHGDPVADLVGFAHRLRADGLTVDVGRVATALRALGAYEPLADSDVYWATRLTLCSRHEDVPVFDAAYRAWFGTPPPALTAAPARWQPDDTEKPAIAVADTNDAVASAQPAPRAGYAERLATPPPWTLSTADFAEVAAFSNAFTASVPLRRVLRRTPAGHGPIDVSRTARTMMRHGCEPVRLWHHDQARVRRRLVLLIDVSESMRSHRNRLLRFAYAAVAVAPTTTEVFTIGTRLDRITRELRLCDPTAAMNALADRRSDWDAGTRLGAAVTIFARVWGGHQVVRAANLVLVSDGWELDEPAPLVAQIARLSRLTHRVIWADPDTSEPGFTSVAPALVDSQPYVHLVAAHDAAALRALAGLLGCTPCGLRCPQHRHLRKWSLPS